MKLVIVFYFISYIESNGSCPSADEYCLSCDGSKCIDCAYTTIVNGKCTIPTAKVNNCATYVAESSTCLSCDWGFKDSLNSCGAITIPNCIHQVSNLCSTCKDTKIAASDLQSCSTKSCSDTNCQQCSTILNVEVCSRCKPGFAVDSTTLKCVSEKTPNCNTQNATKCIECNIGYYHSNDTCKESAS